MAFLVVYITEAHPSDVWQMQSNIKDQVVFASPKNEEERAFIAGACVRKLGIKFPSVLDEFGNSTERAYTGWPDRIYLIDAQGRVAYKSKPGPFGFLTGPVERGPGSHPGTGAQLTVSRSPGDLQRVPPTRFATATRWPRDSRRRSASSRVGLILVSASLVLDFFTASFALPQAFWTLPSTCLAAPFTWASSSPVHSPTWRSTRPAMSLALPSTLSLSI